jgi:hypothetical protein
VLFGRRRTSDTRDERQLLSAGFEFLKRGILFLHFGWKHFAGNHQLMATGQQKKKEGPSLKRRTDLHADAQDVDVSCPPANNIHASKGLTMLGHDDHLRRFKR